MTVAALAHCRIRMPTRGEQLEVAILLVACFERVLLAERMSRPRIRPAGTEKDIDGLVALLLV